MSQFGIRAKLCAGKISIDSSIHAQRPGDFMCRNWRIYGNSDSIIRTTEQEQRSSACVLHSGILPLHCRPRSKPSLRASSARNCLFSSAITDTSSLMTPFKRNWRCCTPQVCVDSLPFRQPEFALATILQAYTGVSDDEVIEATLMD